MTNSIEIVRESDAIKRILNVLEEADTDDLACIYSDVVLSEGVCIVDDDCNAKNPKDIVAMNHTYTHVYTNGQSVGYIDENAEFQEWPVRFTPMNAESFDDKVLYPIQDVKLGTIVCYTSIENMLSLLEHLNRTR